MNRTLQKISAFCLPFAALCLCLSTPSPADDTVIYTGEPVIKIVSESGNTKILEVNITIKGENLSSDYLIENNSVNDAEISVNIDIPPVFWRGAGNWYPDRSYSELQLYINSKAVDYTRKSRAVFKDNDVTDLLLKYGIRPNDIGDDERWTDNMTPETAVRYADLQSIGIFSAGDYPLPQWEACNAYSYKITAKAKEKINIRYEYKYLSGEFYFSSEDKEGLDLLDQVGLSWENMRQKYDGGKSNDDYYQIKYLNLPLWPGNLNAGPDGVPVVNIEIQPGRDHDGRSYLVGLALKGGSVFGKESLRVKLENFKQDSPLLIQIKPLFNSKIE